MKKRILLLIVPFFVIVYQTEAQQMIPVMDNLLIKRIGKNMKKNLEQAALLEVIRGQTKHTKEMVEATEKLQYDYREFLRQTISTASLELSDAEIEQEVIGQVATASGHLNDYTFASNLDKVYQGQSEPLEKSQLLYQQLIPFDENIIFTQLAPFEAYQKARSLYVSALEEMSQRRKLQLANAYQQLAQSKIEKAGELRTLLTTNDQFSMTESERLEIITRMKQYLQESQQLKVKADQLILQSGQPSFSKAQVLNSFKLSQQRKVLGDTPLYQD